MMRPLVVSLTLMHIKKEKNGTICTTKNKNENASCRACLDTPTMPVLRISNTKGGCEEM
jgi:hypothetical protein